MKRALIILIPTIIQIVNTHADFRRIDGFNELPLGEVIGQQGNWFATSQTASIVVDPDNHENQVLAVRTNSGILRRQLLVSNDKAQMLFFRLRCGDQQNYSIGVSALTHPSEFSDLGPEVGMANRWNELRIWEGDLSKYRTLTALDPDTWYNIWMYIDNANDQFQLWANASEGGPAQATDQLATSSDSVFTFRSSGSADLRTFYIKTGGGEAGVGSPDGPIYIDDLYLETASQLLNLENPLTFGPLRITGYELNPTQALIQWEPSGTPIFIQYGEDLKSWQTLPGPVALGSWTGKLPQKTQGFIRLTPIE